MKSKSLLIISFLLFSAVVYSQNQTEINKTDAQGKKQGHWIKKNPDTSILYDGFFKDDHPIGEFRRFYENGKVKSLLVYSDDGITAEATIYHPNGYIASTGKYLNQLKDGKWQFYSSVIKDYVICEEYYSENMKNGSSVKYYQNKKLAEKLGYVKDLKEGEWIQYFPTGKVCLKSFYKNGKLNGSYEVWDENGKIEFSGNYKNDARDGKWLIFNPDGTVKYKIQYVKGVTEDRQMDIDASDYIDFLEQNKGKIADPEKTGVIK